MPKKFIFSEEDKNVIIEKYKTGEFSTSIAEELKISNYLILTLLRENGVRIMGRAGFSLGREKECNDKGRTLMPTKEEILSRITYLPEDGIIFSRLSKKGGKPDARGYKTCRIGGRLYKQHRVIYFLETGEQPEGIDHIDGNKLNNHISNLRAANQSENIANSKSRKNSTSKYKGVSKTKSGSNWIARIAKDGKQIWLGSFLNEKEAAKAYNEAAIKYFGEFAYLNKIEEN